MRLADFKVLTFDCYGTLIDWESGIYDALRPLLTRAAVRLSRQEVLALFAEHEARQQTATPAMLYSDILATVHGQLAERWGAPRDAAEDAAFGASVGDWPAFADSPAALARLKRHYKLVIL
jgi:2-haloacid dehalogenase